MQSQQDHKPSPFQERIAVETFFSGANFDEIQSNIADAVYAGIPIIILTGAEGSGKSMICHQLEAQPGGIYETLLFPKTVDSFEDVVTSLALHLELTFGESETFDLEETLEEVIGILKSEDISLLVVFDEAENIYLATLERIRKMLDRVDGAGAKLHILFSGRNNFLGNYEQLSICDFDEVEELYLATEPLSESETSEYIFGACEKYTEHGAEKIFTQEVIRNIYEVAKGNFRMTNILAEEALQSHTDDNSFMVLLENVKEEVENENLTKVESTLAGMVEQYKPYIPWGGGLAVICVLLFLFLGAEEEKPEEPTERKLVLEIVKPESKENKVLPTVVKDSYQPQQKTSTPPQNPLEVEKTKAQQQTQQISTPKSEVVNEAQFTQPPLVAQIEMEEENLEVADDVSSVGTTENVKRITLQPVAIVEERTVSTAPPPIVSPQADVPPPVKKKEPEPAVQGGNKVVAITPTDRKQKLVSPPLATQDIADVIVELRPDGTMKRRPGSKNSESRNERRMSGAFEVQTQPPFSRPSSAVALLYRDRLTAGKSWRNGNKDHLFTVQLMVLTSSTAEGNLRRMLAEERYRQEAGNFYIFKKDSEPENVMVFYGEYRTIARARLAQNSLPQFLRDHKPYAISIKGAMAKVNK